MKEIYNETIKLFKDLHSHPEKSNYEFLTKRILMDFISSKTKFEVFDMGKWFYAYRKADIKKTKSVAFRADFDAVSLGENNVRHYCGHDGHSASLAGFLLLINNIKTKNDIYAIFEHAEETGDGARECSNLISEKNIDEVYGYHNIPGFKLGEILLKEDTFACASTGMIIKLKGAVSHAAYPSSGKNPSFAMAKIISEIERINNIKHEYIEFITVVGVKVGDRNFGVSAGDCEIDLTLRSEKENSLKDIINQIIQLLNMLSDEYNLESEYQLIEPFPETRNHHENVVNIENICKNNRLDYCYLSEVRNWSEDFGYFLKKTKGAFVGIGNGLTSCDLHTVDYCFNTKIFIVVWRLYLMLID